MYSKLNFQSAAYSAFRRAILGSTLMLVTAFADAGPPKAISYRDALMFNQLTSISNDWSTSEAFNFKESISMPVLIDRLNVPEEGGIVTLSFRLDLSDSQWRERTDSRETVYYATLQTSQEVQRLGISSRDLYEGVHATLTGWPRTRNNFFQTMMLIESIVLKDGESIRFEPHKDFIDSKSSSLNEQLESR